MTNDNAELLTDISRKLNVLIGLSLKMLKEDRGFDKKSKRTSGASILVGYFAKFNLSAQDISEILGIPLQSVRTLLTPKRRKK